MRKEIIHHNWIKKNGSKLKYETPAFRSKDCNDWQNVLYIQFSSVAQSFLTLCDPMDCSTPSFPVHHHLPELTQTHIHWVSDAIQPSHPPSSPSPLAFHLWQHQVLFKWVSSSHQVDKVLEFQLQHPLEWTGWISLQSKGLKSLLQHHSSKASILQCLAFFTVQLSHPYMTTGKIIALTRWTFVGKVTSLLFNMLSRLITAFFQGASVL